MQRQMDWVVFCVALLHLVVAPFTKVEESFSLQACHDLLFKGVNIEEYDHLDFPGVVPRTFVGPIVVSGLAYPFVALSRMLGFSKFFAQYVVRGVLGLLVVLAWRRFRKQLEVLFGQSVTIWFTLITASQFHFMYYLSRPLPNTFALVSALLAFSYWLEQKHAHLIWTSAVAVLIFRSELCLLLGPMLLADLSTQRLQLLPFMKNAIPAGLCCLFTTIAVDSLLWGRLLWPEGEVFWFNTYKNQSGAWGSSPILWYWYSALPRAMGSSLFLVPFGVALDKRLQILITPCVIFVCLYSLLPHKELRFIMYIFPILNAAAAKACHFFWVGREKSGSRQLVAIGCALHLVVNSAFTTLLLTISANNYPGGTAIMRLHKMVPEDTNVYVHIDNFATQTGVSRFSQLNDHWRYNKTEHLKAGSKDMRSFSHLLVEAKSKYSYNLKHYTSSHEVISSVEAFSHLSFNYQQFPPVKVRVKPAIFILKNLEEDNVDWSWMHSIPEDVDEPEEVTIQEMDVPQPAVVDEPLTDELFEAVEPEVKEQYLFTKATERDLYESRMPYMDGSEDGEDAIEPTVTEKYTEDKVEGEPDDKEHDIPTEPKLPESGCFRPEGGGKTNTPRAEEDKAEAPTQSQMSQSVQSEKEGSLAGSCSQCTAGDNSVPDNLVSHSSVTTNESEVREVDDKEVTTEDQSSIKMAASGESNDSVNQSVDVDESSAQSDGVSDSSNDADDTSTVKDESKADEDNTSPNQNCLDNVHIGVQSNSCNQIHSDLIDHRSEVSEDNAQGYSNDNDNNNKDTGNDSSDNDDNNNDSDNNDNDEGYQSTAQTSNLHDIYRTSKDINDVDYNTRHNDISMYKKNSEDYDNVRNVDEEMAFSNIESMPNDRIVKDEQMDSEGYSTTQDIIGDENTFIGVPNIDEGEDIDDNRGMSDAGSVHQKTDHASIDTQDKRYTQIYQDFYETDEDINAPLEAEYFHSKEVDVSDYERENSASHLIIDENPIYKTEGGKTNDKSTVYVDPEYFVEYVDDQNINTDADDIVSEGIDDDDDDDFLGEFHEFIYDPRVVIDDSDDESAHDSDYEIEDTDGESIPPMNNELVIDDTNDDDEDMVKATDDENRIEDDSNDDNDETVSEASDDMNIEETNDDILTYASENEYVIEDKDEKFVGDGNENIIADTDEKNMNDGANVRVIYETDDDDNNVEVVYETDDDSNIGVIYETDEENEALNKVDDGEDDNSIEVKNKNAGDKDTDDIVVHRNEERLLDLENIENTKEHEEQELNHVPDRESLQEHDVTKMAEDDGDVEVNGEGDDNLDSQRKYTSCEMDCDTVDGSEIIHDTETDDDKMVRDRVKIASHDDNDNNDDDGTLVVIGSAADDSDSPLNNDHNAKANTVVVSKSRVVSNNLNSEAEITHQKAKDNVIDHDINTSNSYTSNILNVQDCINNSVPKINPELPEDQEGLKAISPEERPHEDTLTKDQSEEEEGGKETRFVEMTVNLEENEPRAGVSEVSAKQVSPEPQLTPVTERRKEDSELGRD